MYMLYTKYSGVCNLLSNSPALALSLSLTPTPLPFRPPSSPRQHADATSMPARFVHTLTGMADRTRSRNIAQLNISRCGRLGGAASHPSQQSNPSICFCDRSQAVEIDGDSMLEHWHSSAHARELLYSRRIATKTQAAFLCWCPPRLVVLSRCPSGIFFEHYQHCDSQRASSTYGTGAFPAKMLRSGSAVSERLWSRAARFWLVIIPVCSPFNRSRIFFIFFLCPALLSLACTARASTCRNPSTKLVLAASVANILPAVYSAATCKTTAGTSPGQTEAKLDKKKRGYVKNGKVLFSEHGRRRKSKRRRCGG